MRTNKCRRGCGRSIPKWDNMCDVCACFPNSCHSEWFARKHPELWDEKKRLVLSTKQKKKIKEHYETHLKIYIAWRDKKREEGKSEEEIRMLELQEPEGSLVGRLEDLETINMEDDGEDTPKSDLNKCPDCGNPIKAIFFSYNEYQCPVDKDACYHRDDIEVFQDWDLKFDRYECFECEKMWSNVENLKNNIPTEKEIKK